MIKANPYYNSIVDKNANSYLFSISVPLIELTEESIDNINLMIRSELSGLDPNNNIIIHLPTEIPISIWMYLISISQYMPKASLIISTIENIDNITSIVDLPNNLNIINSEI